LRTRSRPARKTATQPLSNSGRRAGRLLKRTVAKSSAETKSGSRNNMNDGRDASMPASNVPKSVSAETTIRSSSEPWPELDHRRPTACHSRKRALHRGRPAPTVAQGAAEAHYRRGTSHRLRKRKLAFQGGSCCIPQALTNIAGPEIGILGQNLLLGPASSKKAKDGGDRNAKTANARNAAHLCRIDGDELKVLHAAPVFIVAGGSIPHK
jgi:hypothetical protein